MLPSSGPGADAQLTASASADGLRGAEQAGGGSVSTFGMAELEFDNLRLGRFGAAVLPKPLYHEAVEVRAGLPSTTQMPSAVVPAK